MKIQSLQDLARLSPSTVLYSESHRDRISSSGNWRSHAEMERLSNEPIETTVVSATPHALTLHDRFTGRTYNIELDGPYVGERDGDEWVYKYNVRDRRSDGDPCHDTFIFADDYFEIYNYESDEGTRYYYKDPNA